MIILYFKLGFYLNHGVAQVIYQWLQYSAVSKMQCWRNKFFACGWLSNNIDLNNILIASRLTEGTFSKVGCHITMVAMETKIPILKLLIFIKKVP